MLSWVLPPLTLYSGFKVKILNVLPTTFLILRLDSIRIHSCTFHRLFFFCVSLFSESLSMTCSKVYYSLIWVQNLLLRSSKMLGQLANHTLHSLPDSFSHLYSGKTRDFWSSKMWLNLHLCSTFYDHEIIE